MADIKAIETRYKGYRFRSRLEARWAVFFDKLGIRYEYELEGFKLPSGASYLPDFYLPQWKTFVEVKASDVMPLPELRKVVEFAISLSDDRKLLLITGSPGGEHMYLVNECGSGSVDEFSQEFDPGISDEELVAAFIDHLKDWAFVEIGAVPGASGWSLVFRSIPPYEDSRLQESYAKARGARFEFGESG